MLIVLDTNVLISGVISNGPPADILQRVISGSLTLAITPEIWTEYVEVLSYPKFFRRGLTPLRRATLLDRLRSSSHDVTLTNPCSVTVRDPNDEMFLAAALAGADALVTGDDDLLTLANDPAIAPLRILSPRDFLNVLADG